MKRYTKEFITEQIRQRNDRELTAELDRILKYCNDQLITDYDAIRATVSAIEEYEGRKADREAERDFNEYEAEHGADGAAWSRRGGSAW